MLGATLAYDRAMVLHLLLSEALVVLDNKCSEEKQVRLEQIRQKQFQLQNNGNSGNNGSGMNVEVDGSNPLLSWSNLHQSVTSVSANAQ